MAVKSGNDDAADGENTAHLEDFLDLAGILDTVDVPIVVIGLDCTVARFNRAASTTFKLQSSDIGRRAGEALAVLPDLDRCCTEVIATGLRDRREARMGDRSFLVRIAPFHANRWTDPRSRHHPDECDCFPREHRTGHLRARVHQSNSQYHRRASGRSRRCFKDSDGEPGFLHDVWVFPGRIGRPAPL